MMGSKIVRWANITNSSADTQQFAAQQMEYLGKVSDGAMVFPYGYHSNVPADVLALIVSVQGNPDNRAVIGVSPKDRPKLAAGETAFYHPQTGGFIIWRAGGNLELNAGSNDIDFTGANFNFTGDTAFTGSVTANGKVIDDTHEHSQGVDSAGDTQVTIIGVD
jgi:phage gp45-like